MSLNIWTFHPVLARGEVAHNESAVFTELCPFEFISMEIVSALRRSITLKLFKIFLQNVVQMSSIIRVLLQRKRTRIP